ncbi:MarR family winged helix-turn-helix transcriptional regulator [Gryllotalpicola reticulitermitis]|uniref:MarR family winged helix-turn-helix transcriptional regulator n=1 Tax=Gryllotalpicola reticulitermitis TaxID=1184153 RepID=A0ABV8QCP9_9MICO
MSNAVDELSTELRSAITRLYSRFRSERIAGEVPDAQLLVLMVLTKQEGLSLTELAASAQVTLGSMSQTTRSLVQLGYATKTRATDDQRKVVFALTDQGRAAAAAARRHRQDWLNSQLAELTADERNDLARIVPLLVRIATH